MGGLKFIKKNYFWLILVSLVFVSLASLWNASRESAIFDETAHIGAGYSCVTELDMRLNPEHPPLIKDLAGLPLLFLNLNFNLEQDFWQKDINGQWDAGKDLLYHEGNNADEILFFARLPIIILFIFLSLFVFKWGREITGIYGGFLAFTLFAFNPNILGHNHYVTTDLAIAGFVALAFYYFIKFLKYPTWKNVLKLGIFLGLLQLAKFSSVVTFPVMALGLILYPFLIEKKRKDISNFVFRIKKLSEMIGKFAVAFLISLILVFSLYSVNTWNMPQEKAEETINYYFSSELNAEGDNQSEILTNEVLNFINQSEIGKPLAYYGLGIAMVFKRVAGGNSVYYLGQVSNQAFVSYFPVVFLLKETFYHLLLYISSLFISIYLFFKFLGQSTRRKVKDTGRLVGTYFKNHIDSVLLSSFVILYLYISITGNLNLGIRHLFPIFIPMIILTSKVVVGFLHRSLDKKRDFLIEISLSVVLILVALEAALTFPYYMSYFNPLGGGVYSGYRMVTDSNADWGQDLKRLKFFLDENPQIENIRVDYFGGGDIRYYLGDKAISWWDSKRPIEAGWYAASVGYLQSSVFSKDKTSADNYEWLLNFEPVTKAGTSIFIYYISDSDLRLISND